MITRLVFLVFVIALALPITALNGPGGNAPSALQISSVSAKGKKHSAKKRPPKPRTTTTQRAVRGQITQTFLNTETIAIPAGAPGTTKGNSNPYPATIEVNGLGNGVITDVDLLLLDVSHKVPEDMDVLLTKDDGRSALVMSDAGRIFAVSNIDLALDDEAAAPLTQFELTSGSFRPTDFSSLGDVPDTFSAPAPALNGSVALSSFDGTNPNGTWRLFVTDDASGDTGDIGSWALRITAEVDLATVDQQVPADQGVKHRQRDTKRGKQGKKGRK